MKLLWCRVRQYQSNHFPMAYIIVTESSHRLHIRPGFLFERVELDLDSVEDGLEDGIPCHLNILHEHNYAVIVRRQVHDDHLLAVFEFVLRHVVVIS